MLQGIVIRGTTPEHEFDLPYPKDFVSEVRITYGQNKRSVFTKTTQDCKIEEGKISLNLTQEETFSLVPGKNVYIEIRMKLLNNAIVQTEEPIGLRVIDCMDTEVM